MKTLVTSVLLTLACMNTFAISDDGNDREVETKMNTELRKQLNRYMIAPIFTDNDQMTGRVDVAFVIDKSGKIQVISCESKNDELSEYVESRLDKVQLESNPNGFWKTTFVSFEFKPEQ